MSTVFLPLKTFCRFSSAMMLRFAFGSWSLFFLMYSHTFLTTSVRGRALVPTIVERAGEIVKGFMNAALGFLLLLAAGLAFAFAFGAAFFAAAFLVAIVKLF